MDATFLGESPPLNSSPDGNGTNAAASGANRREHVRVRPDAVNGLTATLASGSQIRLIDLSKGGAQFETERRFLPNASVSLRLKTRDGEVQVTGRVVRSRIVRLGSGGLGYLVGVAFASTLQTDLGDGTEGTERSGEASRPSSHAAAPKSTAAEDPLAGLEAAAGTASPFEATAQASESTERAADISAEEALAFESTLEAAPAMLTVTATVDTTSEALQDIFNGNDW